MKDVQCYELFGGIALKNHAFSFHFQVRGNFQSMSTGDVMIPSIDAVTIST